MTVGTGEKKEVVVRMVDGVFQRDLTRKTFLQTHKQYT